MFTGLVGYLLVFGWRVGCNSLCGKDLIINMRPNCLSNAVLIGAPDVLVTGLDVAGKLSQLPLPGFPRKGVLLILYHKLVPSTVKEGQLFKLQVIH
jgi:hypothetical protein